MTPFEITITICAVLIVLLMGFTMLLVGWLCQHIKKALYYGTESILRKLDLHDSKLGYIKAASMNNHDVLIDILQKLDNKQPEPTPEWPWTGSPWIGGPWAQCYLPNGNCPNPQRDCINCPRRGEAGNWTTTSNNTEITNNDK